MFACLICILGVVLVDCGIFFFSAISFHVQSEHVVNFISILLPPGSGLSLHLGSLGVMNHFMIHL